LYDEAYDLDRLSFFEVERIVKKFGYQPRDLIYYCEHGKELDYGLVLITSDDDVIRMAEVFLGQKLVMFYMVSFANAIDEVDPNVGEVEEDEDSDEEERMRKVINDLYWQSTPSSSRRSVSTSIATELSFNDVNIYPEYIFIIKWHCQSS
jgi:hypothetical protein